MTEIIRGMSFREIVAADLARVLELNNAAVPAVSSLTADELARLVEMAAVTVVADVDGEVAGFAVGFEPGALYQSENYRYFADRLDDFHYLDRIVVDPAYFRRGIGSGLYDEIERRAAAPVLVCEVNVRPRNDGSLAFHEVRGFRQVDTQDTDGGKKTVALLRKELRASGA